MSFSLAVFSFSSRILWAGCIRGYGGVKGLHKTKHLLATSYHSTVTSSPNFYRKFFSNNSWTSQRTLKAKPTFNGSSHNIPLKNLYTIKTSSSIVKAPFLDYKGSPINIFKLSRPFNRNKILPNFDFYSKSKVKKASKSKSKVILGLFSVATGTIFLVTWDTPYRDKIKLWCAGAFRSAVTIISCVLCMLDYKFLHMRYASKGYESEEYKEARNLVHLRCANRLLRLCRLNTGVYVKAGQHIASLTYVVPKQYTDVLSVLQDKAPYRPMNEVEAIISQEFNGLGSKDLFTEFDETPLAAASLAQVHRARSKDGHEVAVKVQYPDVARLFNVDVWTMQTMSDMITFFFPEFELSWIVTEFKQNLIAEFNFEAEARNAELTKQRFLHRGESFFVPKIYRELSTKRVLTMEFVHGIKINDLEGLRILGVDPTWVRNQLLEVFAEMIFCHGVVHCDPHPGNALVTISPITRKPQLVLLDHGLYRELSDDFRKTYCSLWKALVLNDIDSLAESARILGVGQYTNFLPLIFTQRIPDSLSILGEDMSPEERAIVHHQLKNVKLSDLLDFLERLPRDMLLVFRTINLLRGIHKQLGGTPMEVFSLNAKYATRGFWCETREEKRLRSRKENELRKHVKFTENLTNNGEDVTLGSIRKWYLFGGAPNLRRSLGYLKDQLWLTIRLQGAELIIKCLRWWYRISITNSFPNTPVFQ